MRNPRLFHFAVALCLALASGGCSSSNPPQEEPDPLLHLLSAYTAATKELKRPPMNEAELRKHLPADDVDKYLKSPRDGQPYRIRWGVAYDDPKLNPAEPPVVAYEMVGRDGTHHAVNIMGLTELTDEQVANLPPK